MAFTCSGSSNYCKDSDENINEMFENFSKLPKKLMLESFETIFLSFNTGIILVFEKFWLLLILRPTGS